MISSDWFSGESGSEAEAVLTLLAFFVAVLSELESSAERTFPLDAIIGVLVLTLFQWSSGVDSHEKFCVCACMCVVCSCQWLSKKKKKKSKTGCKNKKLGPVKCMRRENEAKTKNSV